MTSRHLKAALETRWAGVAVVAILILLWEIAANDLVDSRAFPSASAVGLAWWQLIASGEIFGVFGGTLRRMLIGYFAAVVVGGITGLLMGRFRVVYALLEPLVELLRPIPSPAYVPLVILFLGIDDAMKIFVVFFASLFPVLINTYAGVRSVNPVLIDTGRTFGLTSRQITWEIVIPASMPYVFAGLRISLAIALILVIIAEMVAGVDGAGQFIVSTQQAFRVSMTYAGVLSLGVLGYILNRALLFTERKTIGWHVDSRAHT